ncbi:MAG TPA: hypothetical protein VNX28_06580 [Gemmataceae bacterium]|jgi:hypothetical protein|nr:hypothetical protein [Gemmataceae bacterium]
MSGVKLLPLWRFWLVAGLVAFQILLLAVSHDRPVLNCMGVFFILAFAVSIYRSPDFDFLLYAATCRRLPGRGFVLRFKVRLVEKKALQTYADFCQREYDDLVRLFGFSLRHQVSIYLFGSANEIKRITRTLYDLPCDGKFKITIQAALPHSACVHPDTDAILMPVDEEFQTTVRHELAHLFARRIGPEDFLFKCEGLAMWVEYQGQSPRLSDHAISVLKEMKTLESFLDDTLFFAPSTCYASYEIARSFAGFLIERFGWATYCGFYKHAKHGKFLAAFEEAFSMTLADAEALWREDIGSEPKSDACIS